MKKLYVLLSNNQIGYADYLCKCEKCKERGEYELFINDFDNQYLDCIKLFKVCNEIKIASFNLEVILKYQLNHTTSRNYVIW